MRSEFDSRLLHNKKNENKERLVSTVMANNEEGNDSCMYNANLIFAPIVDGALAQPKSKYKIISSK